MSFLVAGYGYVVEDESILAEFGADGCYAVPERPYTPPVSNTDIDMEECIQGMTNVTVYEREPVDDTPDSLSSSSIRDVFDDFRIHQKTVINIKLSKLLGTMIYMTTFANQMDCITVAMFTFSEPLISKTCYTKSHDIEAHHVTRPPHVSDDDLYALGKALKRSVLPNAFIFHGLLEMID
jgi:hypothetical protein